VLVKLLVRLLLPALHCQPVSDHTRTRKHPAITSRLPITVTLRIHSGPGIRTLWGKEHHIEPPRVQFRDVETKCLCRCAVLKPALPLLLELTLLLYPDSSSVFLTDQIAKQQRSNFHSTSLRTVATMVSQSVNKTALHPKGVEYVLTLPNPKAIDIVNSSPRPQY
jgi:hypothetical protein